MTVSNIHLLKDELRKNKKGNIEETIRMFCMKYNRSRKNVLADFEVIRQVGAIEINEGDWKIAEGKEEMLSTDAMRY